MKIHTKLGTLFLAGALSTAAIGTESNTTKLTNSWKQAFLATLPVVFSGPSQIGQHSRAPIDFGPYKTVQAGFITGPFADYGLEIVCTTVYSSILTRVPMIDSQDCLVEVTNSSEHPAFTLDEFVPMMSLPQED